MAKKPPIWQLPALIAGGIAACTASGTFIVQMSKFITVTDRVEAAEEVNERQDKVLDKLGYIAEQNAALMQQLAPPSASAPTTGFREYDAQGVCWMCPLSDRQRCFDEQAWRRCDAS